MEEYLMTALRFLSPVAVGLVLVVGGLAADQAPDEHTGLTVGAKAPAFSLTDQDGKERSLNDFLKKGKVALVFYRSASW